MTRYEADGVSFHMTALPVVPRGDGRAFSAAAHAKSGGIGRAQLRSGLFFGKHQGDCKRIPRAKQTLAQLTLPPRSRCMPNARCPAAGWDPANFRWGEDGVRIFTTSSSRVSSRVIKVRVLHPPWRVRFLHPAVADAGFGIRGNFSGTHLLRPAQWRYDLIVSTGHFAALITRYAFVCGT